MSFKLEHETNWIVKLKFSVWYSLGFFFHLKSHFFRWETGPCVSELQDLGSVGDGMEFWICLSNKLFSSPLSDIYHVLMLFLWFSVISYISSTFFSTPSQGPIYLPRRHHPSNCYSGKSIEFHLSSSHGPLFFAIAPSS